MLRGRAPVRGPRRRDSNRSPLVARSSTCVCRRTGPTGRGVLAHLEVVPYNPWQDRDVNQKRRKAESAGIGASWIRHCGLDQGALSASGSRTVVRSCSSPLRRRRSKSEMRLAIRAPTTAANHRQLYENFFRESPVRPPLAPVIAMKSKSPVPRSSGESERPALLAPPHLRQSTRAGTGRGRARVAAHHPEHATQGRGALPRRGTGRARTQRRFWAGPALRADRASGVGRRSGGRAQTEFVGREEELSLLARRWERARAG